MKFSGGGEIGSFWTPTNDQEDPASIVVYRFSACGLFCSTMNSIIAPVTV